MSVTIKTSRELELMREAGRILALVHEDLAKIIKPGISTYEIDKEGERLIRSYGCIPSFLNYQGYPASICASIDDEVVHGIPSDVVVLKEGQIISIDVTLMLDGWQVDSCFTAPVGKISEEKQRLIRVTEECFWHGAAAAVHGARIGDIGYAVQSHAENNGYNSVRALTGHGIGRKMHEDPSVPNYGVPGRGVRLKQGMTICVEPMIAMGHYAVHQLDDGWTIVTNDHMPAAHYEHTIAIRGDGLPEILTLPNAKWGEI